MKEETVCSINQSKLAIIAYSILLIILTFYTFWLCAISGGRYCEITWKGLALPREIGLAPADQQTLWDAISQWYNYNISMIWLQYLIEILSQWYDYNISMIWLQYFDNMTTISQWYHYNNIMMISLQYHNIMHKNMAPTDQQTLWDAISQWYN